MTSSSRVIRRFAAAVAIVAGLGMIWAPQAQAVDGTWNGSVDGQWTNVANWTTAIPDNTARFTGPGNGNTTIDLDSGAEVRYLRFESANAAAYTIGAGGPNAQTFTLGRNTNPSLTVDNNVTSNQLIDATLMLGRANGGLNVFVYHQDNNGTSNLLTFAGDITTTNTGTKTLYLDNNLWTANGDTTISGVISNGAGSVRLFKYGQSTLTLSNTNNLHDATYIFAGDLVIAGSGSLGSPNVALGVGNTSLDLGGFDQTIGSLYLTFVPSVGVTQNLDTGAKTLTLTGDISQDGNARGTKIISGNLDLGGATRTINACGYPLTISAVITNGGLIVNNARTVLSGQNTYAGGAKVQGGVNGIELAADSVGSVGAITSGPLGTGTLTIGNGKISSDGTTPRTILNDVYVADNGYIGDATRNGYLTFSGPVDFAGNNQRTVTLYSDVAIDGIIDNGGFWAEGDGVALTLNNTGNTFAGYAGWDKGATLVMGAAGAIPATATLGVGLGTGDFGGYDVTVDGITFRTQQNAGLSQTLDSGAGTITLTGNVAIGDARGTKTIAGNLELGVGNHNFAGNNAAYPTMVSSDISGTNASITITGGRWYFSGANTYEGGTTINGNTSLFFADAGAKPASGTVTVVQNGEYGLSMGPFSGSDVVSFLSNTVASVSMNNGSVVAIDTGTEDYTITESMASTSRGLAKWGSGTLKMSGDLDLDSIANPYAMRVYEGTLLLTGNNTNSTGKIRVESGAVLAVTTTNSVPTGAFEFGSGGILRLLNDESTFYPSPSLLSVGNMTIFVSHAPGGTAVNKTHRLTEVRTGASNTITVDGDHGYALTIDRYQPFDNNNNYLTAKTDLNIATLNASKLLPFRVEGGVTVNIGTTTATPYAGGGFRMDGDGIINFNGPCTPVLNQAWQVNGPRVNFYGTMSSNGTARLNVTAGTVGGTGTVEVAVTVSGSAGIDLRDGAVGALTLGNTFALTGAKDANSLRFDLGNGAGGVDKITVAGATTVNTPGAAVIYFNQLGGAPINNGTYTLIEGTGAMEPVSDFYLALADAGGKHFELQVDENKLNVVITSSEAGPASVRWDGDASDSWIIASNWVGDAVIPAWDSNVEFYQTNAANRNTDLDQDFHINSLNYTADAIANTEIDAGIAGSDLILMAGAENGNTAGTGITVDTPNSGTPTHAITANVILVSNQTWVVKSGATLKVGRTSGANDPAISGLEGTVSLTKTGAGTLVISSGYNQGNPLNCNYTGGTIVDAGELELRGRSENSGKIRGPLTINSGATVRGYDEARHGIFGWQNNVVTTVDINGGTLDNAANAAQNVSFTTITMTGGTISESGGANSSWHFCRNQGGVNFITLASTDSSVISSKVRDYGGGEFYGTSVSVFPFTVADGPAEIDLLISGGFDFAAPLIKSGPGLMAFTGANGYSGSTTISGGTVQLGNSGGTGSLNPASSILNSGTFAFSRTNTVTQGIDFGPISGTGGIRQLGSGTVNLVGANSYTGDTVVEDGVLSVDTAYLDDDSDVYLTTGAVMALEFTGSDTIQDLYIDGAPQTVGTWGAVGSAAVNQTNIFSGSGILNVAGSVPTPPTALFSADPTSGTAPMTVTFTDTSSGTITNRYWDFGDGVTQDTTATSVMHTYTNTGTYTVELIVSGALGSDTNTQTDLIVVTASLPTPVFEDGAITFSGGYPVLSFATEAGYLYGLVYKDSLMDATWLPLISEPDYPAPDGWSISVSTGEVMSITDTNAVSESLRFYRIRSTNP